MVGKIPAFTKNLKITVGLFTFVLLLDQFSKHLAKLYLKPVHSVSVIGDFFKLTFVENPGIAFGVLVSNKTSFTVLSIIAVLVIFYYLFKLKDNLLLRTAFAIILGGAFGNLIDRFTAGKVVDFFDFEFFNFNLPSFKFLIFNFHGYAMDRWPVFNIADSAVSIGMIIIIFSALFDKGETEKQE